jgi:hypothetical protein
MIKSFPFLAEAPLRFLKLSIFILSTLTLNSCEKILYLNEGQAVEKVQAYDYFSKISFYDIFDVELKTDSIFSVKLVSPKKFIENIIIREDSGELVFYDENFARWLPDYPRPKLIISFPRLDDELFAQSPVKLTNYDTLRIDKLNLVFLGRTGETDIIMDVNNFKMVNSSDDVGYYYFRGKANSANIWPRGGSQVDASGLVTNYCIVYNNSIGDCYVNVLHKIQARLNTAGNVIYSGHPQEIIITEQSGSGRLLPSGND